MKVLLTICNSSHWLW